MYKRAERKRIAFTGMLFALFHLVLLFTLGCKKDSIEIKQDFDITVFCKVNLGSNGQVLSWEINQSGLTTSSLYEVLYHGDTVLMKRADTVYQILVLDSNGLITTILDSSNHQIDTLHYALYNQSQYLTNLIRVNPFFNLSYTYDSSYSNYYTGTYVQVTLSDTANVVDFVVNPSAYYFNLLHLGKQNTQLIRHIKWGANGGSSTHASESRFTYVLNSIGQVIQKTETYYPPYPASTQLQESDIKRYLTQYIYVKE